MVLNNCLFPSRDIFSKFGKESKKNIEKEAQKDVKSKKPVETRQMFSSSEQIQLQANKQSLGKKVSLLLVSPSTQQMTDFKF